MKSSVFATLALVAISSVVFGCSAGAQGETVGAAQSEESGLAGPEAMFAKVDANKDGKITLDEVKAEAAARFAEADANKNGALEQEERQAMHARGPGRGQGARHGAGPGNGHGPEAGKGAGHGGGFAAMDRDGNGSLSREEAPARLQERFDQVDANHDGKVEQAELQAARQNGAGPGDHQKRDPKAMLAHFDKDGNGTLSREEAPDRMKEHFDRIDTNKNGQIEVEELTAAHQAGPGAMRMGPDADHDGKISLAEFTDRAAKMFAMMDANHDGTVTLEEIRAQHHNRRGGR